MLHPPLNHAWTVTVGSYPCLLCGRDVSAPRFSGLFCYCKPRSSRSYYFCRTVCSCSSLNSFYAGSSRTEEVRGRADPVCHQQHHQLSHLCSCCCSHLYLSQNLHSRVQMWSSRYCHRSLSLWRSKPVMPETPPTLPRLVMQTPILAMLTQKMH